MKRDENQLMKDLIGLEIKAIPNPDFTLETIRKIQLEEAKRLSSKPVFISPILFPAIIFAVSFILLSLLEFFILSLAPENPTLILLSTTISTILLNPTTISLVLSFVLLYYWDRYLTKRSPSKNLI